MRYLKKILAVKLKWVSAMMEWLFNSYWFDYPFGKTPKATRGCYLKLAEKTRDNCYPEIDEYEIQTNFSISEEWLHNLALHTQIVIKEIDLCYAHGRVLYSSLSQYLQNRPSSSMADRITIWETGTARGFSALCMSKALHDQQRPGIIMTFDVLPHRARMYWNCIDDCDGPKSRAELLEPWWSLVSRYIIFHQGDTRLGLPKVQAERIHFAFLDGAHTYEDVMFEFKQIQNHQKEGDMIVYDDYTPNLFPGLVKAVNEICEQYNYDRIILNANEERGYVVATKK